MREIKFRAWDRNEKLLCNVKVTNWDKGCFLEGNSPTPPQIIANGKQYILTIQEGHFVDFENLELMQFTGIKDKNEKEIYEGDIVKWKILISTGRSWMLGLSAEEPKYKTITRVIEFKEQSFNIPDGYSVEVIGNIYENPELINE